MCSKILSMEYILESGRHSWGLRTFMKRLGGLRAFMKRPSRLAHQCILKAPRKHNNFWFDFWDSLLFPINLNLRILSFISRINHDIFQLTGGHSIQQETLKISSFVLIEK